MAMLDSTYFSSGYTMLMQLLNQNHTPTTFLATLFTGLYATYAV
jgi:hypothetical protein